MNPLATLLISTLSFGAPLTLAAMGGFTSERSGVMNIALEGKMLISAIATALAANASHSAWIGLAGGVLASTVLSWSHYVFTQTYRMDQIVSGMAINAIAFGGANYLDKKYTNPSAGALPGLPTNFYIGFSVILPVVLALYMKYARGGLRLLAVGNDPGKARQMGVFPGRIRFAGLTATGVFCGLSGALIVSNAGYYTDQMTAGRGFIALAALILGSWRPLPAMLACFLFGLFQALQIQMQGHPVLGVNVPREVWYSLPYIITVIALAGFLGKSRVPAGMGRF